MSDSNCAMTCSSTGHGCCAISESSTNQNMTEMEFERGLWGAAVNDDLEKTVKLLNKGISPNIKDSSGYTPLHYAVVRSSLKLVETLLEHGGDSNLQTPSILSTPLHRAAAKGRTDIVKLLLKFGGDPKLPDVDGKTALHHTCQSSSNSSPACGQLLINNCPESIQLVDKNGLTPFQVLQKITEDWERVIAKTKSN